MKKKNQGRQFATRAAFAAIIGLTTTAAHALVVETTIEGSDAIWLAGRTDLVIPAANMSWSGGMVRHGGPTPEEILETLPPGYAVNGGDIVRVLDPASGGISFFNGYGGTIYGPEGNGIPGSSTIASFGGISGYIGTQGALVGVFLTDAVPNGPAPATLNFSSSGLGTNFSVLNPGIGQVFYIGNGVNSSLAFQQFIAPTGATRVFFGITDAFGFNGAPGAFDDNDGAYRIRVGINENPDNPITAVPEPETYAMMLAGLGLLGGIARRRKQQSETA